MSRLSFPLYLYTLVHNALFFIRYKIFCRKFDPRIAEYKRANKGILFLCNHTSNIDGTIVGHYLIDRIGIFANAWIMESAYNLLKRVYPPKVFHNLIPVPPVITSYQSDYSAAIEKLVDDTVQRLRAGEHYLLFPAGCLKTSPRELIWGKSAVERILRRYPDVPICFVTIKGLWGSRFSKVAYCEPHSDYETKRWYGICWQWLRIICFNFFFFGPKRKVKIAFEMAGADFPRRGSRREVNKYMENYYNSKWGAFGELLYLVPEYSWSSYCQPIDIREHCWHFHLEPLAGDMKGEWLQKLNEIAPEPVADITPLCHLGRDLGMDSLEIAEFCRWLEQRYRVQIGDPSALLTVGVLAAHVRKEVVDRTTRTLAPRRVFKSAPLRESLLPIRRVARRITLVIPFLKVIGE